MKKSFGVILVAFLFTLWCWTIALAQHADYLPLTKTELRKPFPIHYVAAFDTAKLNELPKNFSIGVNGADVKFDTESELGLTLSGKDKQEKAWVVYLGSQGGLGGDFFTADLDKNGIRDFIFLSRTGGNGLAPTAHIFTLLFDAAGRPVPFEADGYFDWGKKGLPDLIDINGDGKAELVYMNFDDGYWITNLYKANAGRWEVVNGPLGKRRFPLYTRFTNRPNHRAVTPKPQRHPFAPQLANKTPILAGRMLSFNWADDSASSPSNSPDGLTFVIEDTAGKKIVCDPDEWYGSAHLVMDTQEGRKVIALWSDPKTVKSFLDEIITQKYQVTLFGKRFADKVSPELIWAAK